MEKPQHKDIVFCPESFFCEKITKWELLFTFTFLTAVLLHGGCSFTRTTSALITPHSHEKEIPAEYDLTKHTDQKILVLVDQPAYLNVEINLRYYLTRAMHESLIAKIGIRREYIVPYNELSEFRSNKGDFSLLSHVEVGEALGADMVLLIVVEDYQFDEMVETNYYRGFLDAQAVFLDTATGEKLWPETAKSKSIKVGFEVEERGREVAVERLVAACAYCTTRYFYDCPKGKFKIFDDKSRIGWESWKE
jgi:hypothetical protein